MKGYKAFSRDLKCMDFQYKEGETYEIEGTPILCQHGFHFCKDLVLTLAYYPVDNCITENCYAEVEILGEVEYEQPIKHKGVTNKIKILRIIPDKEVKSMVDDKSNSGNSNSGNRNSGDWNSGNRNSGDSNSGYRNSGDSNSGDWNSGYSNSGDWNSGNSNSGDWNSGYRNSGNRNSGDSNSGYRNSGNSNSGNSNSGNSNSGDWNSGYRNSGNSNSGDWNSCDREAGFFNSKQSKTIRVFNKNCKLSVWENSYKPSFMYFEVDEKLGYKESFKKSWDEADKEDRERVKDLPNFNARVFFEISGIDLRLT